MTVITSKSEKDCLLCLNCSKFIVNASQHSCRFISTVMIRTNHSTNKCDIDESIFRLPVDYTNYTDYSSCLDCTNMCDIDESIFRFPVDCTNYTDYISCLDCTNKDLKSTLISSNKCVSCPTKTVSNSFFTYSNYNNNSITIDSESPVVNLSSFQLSRHMLSVLSKGLNFCPTPGEPNMYELRKDLDKFHVSLRRKQFFSKKTDLDDSTTSIFNTSLSYTSLYSVDEPFSHQKFKNPSSWNPAGPANLEAMIISNEHSLNGYTPHSPVGHNLSVQEKEALTILKNNTNIVIKKADKGSAVVIQNRIDYINEGLRQLSDSNFYQEVPEDLTNKHNKEVSELINEMVVTGEISKDCAKYLYNAQPRTPQLYLLPKIHKNKLPVPGRPIVSASNSPTEKISQLADHFLQPIVCTTKSFVKDTTDFINKIEQIPYLPNNAILATIDVTSLYTNIPNDEGIQACKIQLNRHRVSDEKPSNDHILRMLEYVLKKNNFDFDGKHYLQTGGTAMGTRLAPSFANIFMSYFEDNFVYNHHLQPTIWLRYIDDIFLIWLHGDNEFQSFLDHLNTCHNTIKFTAEISNQSVNFLDTKVVLDNTRKLYTTLYCKPTDSHNYLSFESAHPTHTKKGLPYSQLLRVRRICQKIEDYDTNSVMIGSHFIRRGYSPELIEQNIIEVRRLDRGSLLQQKAPASLDTENQKFFVISTFTPEQNILKNIVQPNWSLLGRTNTTSGIHSSRIIFGYRRNVNLKDILVRAKLPNELPPTTRKNNRKSCPKLNCEYCKRLDLTGHITSATTGRTYNTRHQVSCKSNNLIYCITCLCCNKQYVGQTKKCLHERFYYHYRSIRGPKSKPRPRKKKQATPHQPQTSKYDNPIERHFKLPNHRGLDSIKIHILQFISAPSQSTPAQDLRNEWELLWIHRLKTLSPLGLNISD